MFGLFSKKKNANPAAASAPAPQPPARHDASPTATHPPPQAAGIAYYPQLIEELVADHRQLQALQKDIRQAFGQRNLARVARDLDEFGMLLRNHLLKENMRLYIYLQQRVAGDTMNSALVRSFRKEMDGLAQVALDFLAKYKTIERMPSTEAINFLAELDHIGSAVHGRMQREEQTLYPLYAPGY